MQNLLSIFYALGANISFATASLYFTDFSNKISSFWMNYFKVLIAFVGFSIVCLVFQIPFHLSSVSLLFFMVSGAVGLLIGDIFLFKAFMALGSGRTLMIFGFQPLLLGLSSYYLYGVQFSFYRLVAILFLILCLFCFAFESFKSKGKWDIQGLGFALFGVVLDALGVMLTKHAFRQSPEVSVVAANFIRSGTALLGFFILSQLPYFKMNLAQPFLKLNKKDKGLVIMAGGLGTFLSLTFYLQAIQLGNIATVTAITGTSPLFATFFEVFRGRKKITKYLVIAMLSFITGLGILILL
jgi:drug/metabolite transporter (DMT)-like permease